MFIIYFVVSLDEILLSNFCKVKQISQIKSGSHQSVVSKYISKFFKSDTLEKWNLFKFNNKEIRTKLLGAILVQKKCPFTSDVLLRVTYFYERRTFWMTLLMNLNEFANGSKFPKLKIVWFPWFPGEMLPQNIFAIVGKTLK